MKQIKQFFLEGEGPTLILLMRFKIIDQVKQNMHLYTSNTNTRSPLNLRNVLIFFLDLHHVTGRQSF